MLYACLDRFRLREEPTPAALDVSVVKHGASVRPGMSWFGGFTARKSQARTSHTCAHRVQPDKMRAKEQTKHEILAEYIQHKTVCSGRPVFRSRRTLSPDVRDVESKDDAPMQRVGNIRRRKAFRLKTMTTRVSKRFFGGFHKKMVIQRRHRWPRIRINMDLIMIDNQVPVTVDTFGSHKGPIT